MQLFKYGFDTLPEWYLNIDENITIRINDVYGEIIKHYDGLVDIVTFKKGDYIVKDIIGDIYVIPKKDYEDFYIVEER